MIEQKSPVQNVKLYFDEDMSAILAARLRKAGWDVLTTHQAHRRSSDDQSQLQFATNQQRILVTRNYADFQRIHTDSLTAGASHAGIIICFWHPNPQKMQTKLLEVLKTTPPDQWENQLLYA